MKYFFLPFLFILSPLHAQTEASPEANKDNAPIQADLTANQKEFSNLPEEKRTEFMKHFGDASRFYQQQRIFECLEAISEAEAVFPQSAELLNLRGSCFVEMRAFDKALIAFTEAQKLDPKNISLRFNLGEVLFVSKQWQQAHDAFQSLLPDIPESNMALSRLVEFKILLCKVKLKLTDEVTILAQKYDYQDDSPFHYYAQAMLAYEKNERREAEQWLARASRIFKNTNVIASWQDAITEFGYLKSMHIDENGEAVEP